MDTDLATALDQTDRTDVGVGPFADLHLGLAVSPTDRAHCGRVRFEVYCRERGFEDPAAFPDGIERDEYDDRAWHVLARDAWGFAVGCVRLIHPQPDRPVNALRFLPSGSEAMIDPTSTCEVSRLAVLPTARDQHHVACALSHAAVHLFLRSGLTVMVIIARRALGRLLIQRDGIPFTAVGEEFEYHGRRQLFRMSRVDALNLAPQAAIWQDAAATALATGSPVWPPLDVPMLAVRS